MATDHFEKHFHKPNQVDWNFNVLFNGQPDVSRMAEQYAQVLQHPGLYKPIPPQWLHSTILRVGLVDDYTEAEMLAVADKLQDKLANLKLPEFFFDSWWLWGGNVVFHISPDDQFTKVYDEVIAALEAVVGSDRTTKSPHESFIAHTSLVYSKAHNSEREIHDKLLANPVKPATFNARSVSLIKQWSTDGHYEWEVVKDISIGRNTIGSSS
jgi:2'-5' RNA ligase